MAYRVRRRARRGGKSTANWIRARLVGVLFIAFAVVIVSAITYLTNLVPSSYIVVTNNSLSVSPTLPSGASGLDSKLVIGILGWGSGIFLFYSGVRRLGVKI